MNPATIPYGQVLLVGTQSLSPYLSRLLCFISLFLLHSRGSASGKRVQANMGAKNHAVVLPDADVDSTVAALTVIAKSLLGWLAGWSLVG